MNNFIYYHYTTIAGCHGIITTGKMWFTDYRFLNDKNELTFGLSALMEYFPEEKRISFETAFKVHETNTPQYLLSLSKTPKILNQWQGYAADGTGIAIGFHKQLMEKVGISFVECKYEDYAVYLKELVNKHESFIDSVHLAMPNKNTSIENFIDWVGVHKNEFQAVIKDIMPLKNVAFKNEEEIRAIYTLSDDDKIMTRISGDRIIPYVEVVLWKDGDDDLTIERFVHEIWLGPKCDTRNKIALKVFNIRYCEIEKYDCGYV